MSKLKYFLVLSLIVLSVLTSACKQEKGTNDLRLGTIAGPETDLIETLKQVAHDRYGLNVEIVQFSDYSMPNEALANGDIDANIFQHLPYLENSIKANGYRISPIAKGFIYPMGVYSKKIKNLSQLHDGAIVAVPNDPSNESRALLLLQKGGLLQLNPNAGTNATKADIVANPKNLVIKEIDAAQLPRVLPDVDLAAINTNYAMLANLLPSKDALIVEDSNSPYANLVVVRMEDRDDPRFISLIAALHSAEVLHKAQELFKGQAVPAWKTVSSSNTVGDQPL